MLATLWTFWGYVRELFNRLRREYTRRGKTERNLDLRRYLPSKGTHKKEGRLPPEIILGRID